MSAWWLRSQALHPKKNERTLEPQKTVYIIYVGDAQLCTVIEVYSDAIKDYHLHSYLLVN